MTDYISREAAIEKITALINKSGKYTAYESGADDACFILENEIPAADVKPVIHASWERIEKYDPESNVICSNCKEEFSYIDGLGNLVIGYDLPRFCPACGATMMKGDNNG